MSFFGVGMFGPIVDLVLLVVAILIVVLIIKKSKSKSRSNGKNGVIADEAQAGPRIVVEYERDGGLFEDGKCGWLDVECEDGESRTLKLDFNKKSPTPIIVPLKKAVYRITYRSKSKAAMVASGVLNAINESNGAMGSFANAVYDLGGMNGSFDSVVVKVDDEFVLRLSCTTDGINKSCNVI